MPKLNISRTQTINAPIKKVHAIIADFNQWQPWSPWLIAEPEAKVIVQQGGKSYSWEGHRVGSGEMEIAYETETHINYNLRFLKPWKSKAKVDFYLSPKENITQVTWTMQSDWPIFLFWMKKQTEAFIGMDYERGLLMLKEFAEDGKIKSKLEFVGRQTYEGCNFVGISRKVPIKDVGKAMEQDFTALYQWLEHNEVEILGEPFSQYHKWNMVKKIVHYTSAIPIKTSTQKLPPNAKAGQLPKTDVYVLRHYGSYNHLGNAWSTIMMQQRNKEFKANKKLPPFERYINDPANTKPEDLITDVCFAI